MSVAYKGTNNASGTLLGAITAGATSLTLQSGEGDLFPTTFPFMLTIEQYTGDNVTKREVVRCTNKSSDTFTIVRSAEECRQVYTDTALGDTAQSFDADDVVRLDFTAGMLTEIISGKSNVDDIVDDLVSTDTDKPLSANQGKELEDNKINISDIVDTLVSASTTAPLSANQGKQLQDTKINTADIVDTLVSTSTVYPLSANQGKELKDLIDAIDTGKVVAGVGSFTYGTATISQFYAAFTNGSSLTIGGSVTVPAGKTSISSIKFLDLRGGVTTGNIYFQATFGKLRSGAEYLTDLYSTPIAVSAGTANYIEEIEIPSSGYNGLGAVEGGDIITFQIIRLGDNASDTFEANYNLSGVEVIFA